jgi:hypothetical protein
MASLFVSAGHGGFEGILRDSGAIAFGTTEAQEMMLTGDLLVAELRQRGIDTFSVPDILSLSEQYFSPKLTAKPWQHYVHRCQNPAVSEGKCAK